MARLRQLIRQVQGREEENKEDSTNFAQDDDGWADPSESSPTRPIDSIALIRLVHDLGAWDPHQHAHRSSRRQAATRRARFLSDRDNSNAEECIAPLSRAHDQQKFRPPVYDDDEDAIQVNDSDYESR